MISLFTRLFRPAENSGSSDAMPASSKRAYASIHEAATSGDTQAVQRFLDQGVNPHERDTNDNSPMHLAVMHNFPEIITALNKAGVNADERNDENNTMLYVAVGYGHIDAIKALLAAGADINGRSSSKQTALYKATHSHYFLEPEKTFGIVRILLDSGADVNAVDKDGNTALYSLSNKSLVRHLLESGANPNIQNCSGSTALHRAVRCEEIGIIRLLLAAGADRTIANMFGKTSNDIAQEDGVDLDALVAERERQILRQTVGLEGAVHVARPARRM